MIAKSNKKVLYEHLTKKKDLVKYQVKSIKTEVGLVADETSFFTVFNDAPKDIYEFCVMDSIVYQMDEYCNDYGGHLSQKVMLKNIKFHSD